MDKIAQCDIIVAAKTTAEQHKKQWIYHASKATEEQHAFFI